MIRYRVHKYSLLLIPNPDSLKDTWIATITLLRIEGPDAQDLVHIPTPSQVDDYTCFKQIEKREITRLVGSGAYQQWKASEESRIATSVPTPADKAVGRAGIHVFNKGKGRAFK